MTLEQMSLTAGAAIALTALLRWTMGARLPRRLFVALWDMAALRLLVPFAVPWRFAPQAALTGLLARPRPETAVRIGGVAAGFAAPVGQGTAAATQAAGAALAQPDARAMLGAVWLTGMLAVWAYFACAGARGLRIFAESLPDGDPRTAAFLCDHPTVRRVQARTSDRIAAPLSCGVLRPVILLPKGMDRTGHALELVLLHELEHIRALDALRKLMLVAAVGVHWMNPLAWVMFLLANRDMELLCDARVLARMGQAARRAYAATLLDLEERRSRLAPLANGFSMTAIEERIIAMKDMKKMSAASVLLAAMLALGAGIALATGAPETNGPESEAQDVAVTMTEARTAVATESAGVTISMESWEEHYKRYAPYGLTWDGDGRLCFEGKRVRYFEDMYPAGPDSETGMVVQFSDGEVDVYAVRDLTAPIVRSADGSFDPGGVLTGLRAATKAEFDAHTQRMADGASPALEADATAYAYTLTEGGEAYTAEIGMAEGPEIVWWTAEEYEAYVEAQCAAMAEMVAAGESAWTSGDGWFVWTQEKMDEMMALYAQNLADIRAGVRISKTVNGTDDIVIAQDARNAETH